VLSNWKQARGLPVLFAQRQGASLCSEDDLMAAVRTAHRAGLDYKFLQQRLEHDDCLEANELDSTMLDAANRFMMSIVTDTEMNLSPEDSCDSECVEFGVN